MTASLGVLLTVMVIVEFVVTEWMGLRLEQRHSGSGGATGTEQ